MRSRFPLWVYWTVTGAALLAALICSVMLAGSDLAPGEAPRLFFLIWGGPLTLLVSTALITWLARSASRD